MQGASRESLALLRDRLSELTDGIDSAGAQSLADELFSVVTVFATQASLRRALSDPSLQPQQKLGLVDTLLGSRVGEATMELLRASARARWSAPVDVVDSLEYLAVEAALVRAEQDDELDEVEDQLFRFERILTGEPGLRSALTDRNLPADNKLRLLHQLLDGKVAAVTFTLVERAVLAPRGRTLERVLDEFSELAAKRRQRLLARVTSAVPLSDDQQQRLTESLRTAFGSDVRLQLVVDPDLVGGVTVRIGDELLDASVARQLGEVRRRLTGRR